MNKLTMKFLKEYNEFREYLDAVFGKQNSSIIINNYSKISTKEDEIQLKKIRQYRNEVAHNIESFEISDECIEEWIVFLNKQRIFCENNKDIIKDKLGL
jgi:hypothetical protein